MNQPTQTDQKFEDFYHFPSGDEFDSRELQTDYSFSTPKLSGPGRSNKEKFEIGYEWVKKLLLFLPGAWFLYLTTLAFVFMYSKIGLSFSFMIWFAAGSFIVLLGLGDIRKVRHLAIPASIIGLALTLAAAFSLFPSSMQAALFFEYSMYFFPLVLIVPVMVKQMVDAEPPL